MRASKFFTTAVAICTTGVVPAGEPVKVEMKITAVGNPHGGKLQSNSTGCAELLFKNRTAKKISVLTAPRRLGKGRVENWNDASYIAPKEGDAWGYLYDVPIVVIEFLNERGKVVHRHGAIQMGAIEELDPDGEDATPIFFSTPAIPGVYTLRLFFDNTIMERGSGSNGDNGVPENLVTVKDQIQIPGVSVIPAKAEQAGAGQPATAPAVNETQVMEERWLVIQPDLFAVEGKRHVGAKIRFTEMVLGDVKADSPIVFQIKGGVTIRASNVSKRHRTEIATAHKPPTFVTMEATITSIDPAKRIVSMKATKVEVTW